MARILGKRNLAVILVGRETNGTGWRREMIELEERRSRERGLFNSISGNGVNLRKSATTSSRSFNMLCTGPDWGPSRGAAGESGKCSSSELVELLHCTKRNCRKFHIRRDFRRSAASAYWQNHSNPPLKPLEFYLVKFDLDNFNSCCLLADIGSWS